MNRIRNGESIPFRPNLPEAVELGKPMLDLIRNSWTEDYQNRPSFTQIRILLRKITGGEYVQRIIMIYLLGFIKPTYAYKYLEAIVCRNNYSTHHKSRLHNRVYVP